MPDQELQCVDCGIAFPFNEGEQQFYESKNLTPPKRCKECRAKKKIDRMREEQGEDKGQDFNRDKWSDGAHTDGVEN